MDVHFVEATNGPQNHGKFAVCKFTDDEWKYVSKVDGRPLLAGRGWTREHILVIDLQTGEGAFFFPVGIHKSDLDKHRIWVCPMFEAALIHIGDGDHNPMKTEAVIDLPDVPFEMAGYRRPGPPDPVRDAALNVLVAYDDYMDTDQLDSLAEAIGVLRSAVR